METWAEYAIVISIGLLFYTYAGYPLVLGGLSLLLGKREDRQERPSDWPKVTVVLSAYNEEAVIAQRIQNLLQLDYPADRLRVVIGSDGSSDRTCEIAGKHRDPRIALYAFTARRGKANVLNDLVSRIHDGIVVFTDANTFFLPDAVKELVRGFQEDPSACCVVGRLEFRTGSGTVNPDSLYWKYESRLKQMESRFGALLGANGAIYAIKRAGYCPLPAGTIVDDFLIPLLMRLKGGGSVIFRPSARAWELTPETIRDEFRRRVRIGAGDAHALLQTWRLLLPHQGMFAVSYWSHKVLRWMGPALLLLTFTSNLVLLNHVWAQWLLAAQLAAYGLGLASPWLRSVPVLGKVGTAASYFIVLNAALLIGFLKFVWGMPGQTWQTTPRTAELSFAADQQFGDEAVSDPRVDRRAA